MSGWKYQGSGHRGSVNIEEWAPAGEHVRREANSDSEGYGTASSSLQTVLGCPQAVWYLKVH